jgi:peroxidase
LFYLDISEPRRKSVLGGLLPACRKISLALGSKPVFDRKFNNLFAGFGQYFAHDIALALPVSDTYATPITSCTCDSKYDWNKCTVIDIQADDPYLRGQKCMAFPATAQAFKDQICSLGVKEQLNANTHFLDLSGLYGSTLRIALAVRAENGLLKSTRRSWAKYEFPPAQREGKSCTDSTYKRKCFAGGLNRKNFILFIFSLNR